MRAMRIAIACALLAGFGAPTGAAAGEEVFHYELAAGSRYLHGCFEPCLCTLMAVEGVEGTFSLRFKESTPLYEIYAVEDLEWTVPQDPPLRVTGSGEYWTGGEVAPTQRLVLELRVGDGEAAVFDSGVVTGGSGFPDTLEISVSQNGRVCLDTVFDIAAKRVETAVEFSRGDCNDDARRDISDAVALLLYLFRGQAEPACLDACDNDDDGELSLTDAVVLLRHLFLGESPPPPPYPGCGPDPTEDALSCLRQESCARAPRCEEAASKIAEEVRMNEITSAVVRYKPSEGRFLGWQLFGGPLAPIGEEEARKRAQEVTGYGEGARALHPSDPESVYLFFAPPADFGGMAAVSARTGLVLFGASIVWAGTGRIAYPEVWRPALILEEGDCEPLARRRVPVFVYGRDDGTVDLPELEAVLDALWATPLVHGLASAGEILSIVAFGYAPSAGIVDLESAELILVLDASRAR